MLAENLLLTNVEVGNQLLRIRTVTVTKISYFKLKL